MGNLLVVRRVYFILAEYIDPHCSAYTASYHLHSFGSIVTPIHKIIPDNMKARLLVVNYWFYLWAKTNWFFIKLSFFSYRCLVFLLKAEVFIFFLFLWLDFLVSIIWELPFPYIFYDHFEKLVL